MRAPIRGGRSGAGPQCAAAKRSAADQRPAAALQSAAAPIHRGGPGADQRGGAAPQCAAAKRSAAVQRCAVDGRPGVGARRLRAWLGAALALACAACSTLPPAGPEQAAMAVRRQAVDYARQGDANLALRNWTLAQGFYQKSLEANQSIDNLEGVVQSRFSLGFLYLDRSMPGDADREFQVAAELADQLGSRWYRAQALLNLAKLRLWQRDAAVALELLDQALDCWRSPDERLAPPAPGVEPPAPPDDRARTVQYAAILHNRGVAYKDRGRPAEARADLNAALAANAGIQAVKERAGNLYVLASIDNAEGKPADALAKLGDALALDKQVEASAGIAADLYAMAAVLRKLPDEHGQPRLQEAYACLARAYQAWLAIDDPEGTERGLVQLIELAGKLDRDDDRARYAAQLARLRAEINKEKK